VALWHARPMRAAPLVLVLLLGCPTAVPTPADPPPTSDLTLAHWTTFGSLGVGEVHLDLVDTSRETPESGDQAALPERTLPTTVWYPATEGHALQPALDAPAADGTFPLVVNSHGFMSAASDHAGLAAFLASHGYVVAAVEFPLSSRNTPGDADPADAINQPGDVSFVIDSVLADDGVLAGLADPDRIAASGLSLGGLTTLAVGLHPAVADPRLDALIAMAPATCILGDDIFDAPNLPLLVMHGDGDTILPFEDNIPPLIDGLTGPWWLATLAHGTHTGFPDSAAGLLDGLDHADSVGCSSIAGNLPDGAENTDIDPLDDTGPVLGPDCAAPCQDPSLLVDGMKPTRQVELSYGLARAFLDAQLEGDGEGSLWLEAGVGDQEADVTMSFGP